MDYIAGNIRAFETTLRERCGDNNIRIGPIVDDYDITLSGGPRRRSAKQITEQLIDYLMQRTLRSRDVVREQLCGVFANAAWNNYRADFMRLLDPMVK